MKEFGQRTCSTASLLALDSPIERIHADSRRTGRKGELSMMKRLAWEQKVQEPVESKTSGHTNE